MKNRFLLIVLMMVFSTNLWAYDFQSGDLCYNITSNNTVEVVCGVSDITVVNIPNSVNYGGVMYAVTSVGETAFAYNPNLKSVIVGDSVININKESFAGCRGLTSVTIGNKVTSIGTGAFNSCSGLLSIILPDSVKSIGINAFFACSSLTTLTIPKSVTYIGDNAFDGCDKIENLICNTNAVGTIFRGRTSIKTLTIGEYVTSIADNAFYGCSGLTSLTICNEDVAIGKNAFSGCDNLDYNRYDNGYYIGNDKNPHLVLMAARNKNIESCTINDRCKVIYKAFEDCRNLSEIVIPDSVKCLGYYAFRGCVGLSSAIISNSVTSIGERALSGCSKLNSLTIPNSVKSIGYEAFVGSGFTSIIIGDSVISIGNYAFSGCSNLLSVVIPNSVTSIGNNAFSSCSSLKSIIIGNSVTNIGENAFNSCHNLNLIINKATTPPILSVDVLKNNDTIYVPAISVEAYQLASFWKMKEILPFYNVKVVSANDLQGVVNGDSLLLGGKNITITAVPTEGFHFEMWSDNETDNPRIYSDASDTSFTAIFKAHTIVKDSAVAATCSAIGLTEGSHCSICGEIIVAQDTLPMLEHTIVVDNAVAPTCTESGLTEGNHCSVCNAILVAQEVVPANGHMEVTDAAVAATCVEKGKTEGSHCSVCGVVFVAQTEIPELGHKFVNYIYNNDATTEADGTETAACGHGCGATDTRTAAGTKIAQTPEPGTAVAESAANAINIYAHGNTIIVENATEEIRVYDAMGRIVGRDAINRVRIELRVNTAGVYIVKVGNVAKRIMVY